MTPIQITSRLSSAIAIVSNLLASVVLITALSAPPEIISYTNLVNEYAIPSTALLDGDGLTILDENGEYIEEEYA